jgi:hypothetical protein
MPRCLDPYRPINDLAAAMECIPLQQPRPSRAKVTEAINHHGWQALGLFITHARGHPGAAAEARVTLWTSLGLPSQGLARGTSFSANRITQH